MGVLNYNHFANEGFGWLSFLLFFVNGQPTEGSPSLGEAFNAGAPEVEPIVVGRERWNEKPEPEDLSKPQITQEITGAQDRNTEPSSGRIGELDPWKPNRLSKPIHSSSRPSKNIPATRIVRNFDGKLYLV